MVCWCVCGVEWCVCVCTVTQYSSIFWVCDHMMKLRNIRGVCEFVSLSMNSITVCVSMGVGGGQYEAATFSQH